MDLSTSLHLTAKGIEEVRSRTYKLSIRRRSVLLLLDRPQTFEYVANKTVIPRNEIAEEITALIQDGFLYSGDIKARDAGAIAAAGKNDRLLLGEDIILSKARFLLIDFCVDSFGTQSQEFVDEIRASRDVDSIGTCVRRIFSLAEKKHPDKLARLLNLVKEINATAL